MYRETLAVQRRLLGPENLDTLATANNLAIALNEQGKNAEAETIFCEVLAVQRRVLGREHPDTLTTVTSLANTLNEQGKRAETETMYHDVLTIQRRVLGPECSPGNVEDGSVCGHHTLQQRQARRCREIVPRRAGCSAAGAGTRAPRHFADGQQSGRSTQGPMQIRRSRDVVPRDACAVQRRVLGPEHPSTLFTATVLALALNEQGKHAEAETMHRETLAVQQRVL
jgi:hypothetical protein